jgi:hypothetical protein
MVLGMTQPRFTARQIVQKVGRTNICRLLGVKPDATRKWYAAGIPGRHWMKLVKNVDWLTYTLLEEAAEAARRRALQKD